LASTATIEPQADRSVSPIAFDRDRTILRQRVLWIVFAAALGVRLLFCFGLIPLLGWSDTIGHRAPEFHITTDGYLQIAENLVNHGSFSFAPEGPPTTYRGPSYPLALAGAYWICGDIGVAAVWVNCIASALACVFLFLIARHFLGARATGWVAVPLVLFPLSIYYCASSFADAFLTFGVTAYAYALIRLFKKPTAGKGVLTGLAFTLATLTKGILVPFPVLTLAYALVRKRSALAACTLAAVIGYAGVGVWTARNYALTRHVIPVSVGPGFSMLAGNYMIEESSNANAALAHGEAKALARMNKRYNRHWTRNSLKTAGSWNISPETDALFVRESIAMFKSDPTLLPKKLAINAWRFWFFSSSPWKSRANLAVNLPILLLGAICLWRLHKQYPAGVELLALLTVFFVLIYSAVNICSSRYGLPVFMLLTPFATRTALDLTHRFRKRQEPVT